MNRAAVSLAADSAATATSGRQLGQKVFPNADKIFALSKRDPVGVMFWGSSSHMGVPWETIVKFLRGKLPATPPSTISEYLTWFCSQVDSLPELRLPNAEQAHIVSVIRSVYEAILGEAEEAFDAVVADTGRISVADMIRIARKLLEDAEESLARGALLDGIDAPAKQAIADAVRDPSSALARELFPMLFEDDAAWTARILHQVALHVFTTEAPINGLPRTGVVIAGFGADQVVPELIEIVNLGKICGIPHRVQRRRYNMASDPPQIIPFAQREEVDSFFRGIHPQYERKLQQVRARLRDAADAATTSAAGALTQAQRDQISHAVVGSIETAWDRHMQDLKQFQQNEFIGPIAEVASHLTKDQLAQMAETLVSLTSFKRKMSWQTETVGGPIDVAVITKGDGLVWIKRKHYFPPELNGHYFRR